VLAIFHMMFHFTVVISINYSTMTVGLYLNLFQFQFIFGVIFSGIFLRRRPTAGQIFASIFILAASAAFVLVQYDRMHFTPF